MQRHLILISALFGLLLGGGLWWYSSHRAATETATRGPEKFARGSEDLKSLAGTDIDGDSKSEFDPITGSDLLNGLRVSTITLCRVGEFEKAGQLVKDSSLSAKERDALLKLLVDELIPSDWVAEQRLERLWHHRDSAWEDRLNRRWQIYLNTLDSIESPYLKCRALCRGLFLVENLLTVSTRPKPNVDVEMGLPMNDSASETANHQHSRSNSVPMPLSPGQRESLIGQVEETTKHLKPTYVNMDSWFFNVLRTVCLTAFFPLLTVGTQTLTQKVFEGIGSKVSSDLIASLSRSQQIQLNPSLPNTGSPDVGA